MPSSRKACGSSGSIACGDKTFIHEAASSIASGNPSSCTQISPTAPAFSGVSSQPERNARVRSTNNATAST